MAAKPLNSSYRWASLAIEFHHHASMVEHSAQDTRPREPMLRQYSSVVSKPSRSMKGSPCG